MLVFAPTKEEALKGLNVIFQQLQDCNLKLSPIKCHLMRVSVKFLGHNIDRRGVAVDTKVKVISEMSKADLIKGNGFTPYVRRIKSSEDALGMH